MTVENNRISQSTASWVIGNSFPVPINSKIQDGGSSPQKNSPFQRCLHNLETCHRLESIQKSFLKAHNYIVRRRKRTVVMIKTGKNFHDKLMNKLRHETEVEL